MTLEMRTSEIIQVGPKPNDKSLVKTKQRLELRCQTPRNACGSQKLEEERQDSS